MKSYRVTTKAQFGWVRTQFLYLSGGVIPHRQGSSPNMILKTKKQTTTNMPPPDPLCSVKLLLRKVLPAQLLIICAAGNAGPDMAVLQARNL
jgi:hypothetical protein